MTSLSGDMISFAWYEMRVMLFPSNWWIARDGFNEYEEYGIFRRTDKEEGEEEDIFEWNKNNIK